MISTKNSYRAKMGLDAVAYGSGEGAGREACIDAVANILHHAAAEGFDPDAIIRMAVAHFEAERV